MMDEVIDEKTGNSVDVGNRVNVNADSNFIVYNPSADKLHDDPNVALFFLEKDLRQGTENFIHRNSSIYRKSTKFNTFFSNSKSGPKFLPRNVVDAIPFSSAKISETLKHFSIEPNSQDAQTMMKTIKECEEPAVKGETKYCATSLESMVDFANSQLGTNIKALATETKKEAPKQLYTVVAGVHKMASPKSVAFHSEAYVHAVYYCHQTSDTTAHVVPLVGKYKVKVDAVAVCHKDTSQWNPKHIAFQMLKVKPGSVPICHFIPQDHVLWVQN
ncbi:RD22-like protein precursor [Cinnamomum micranthum f. kanehirae]|uniref:RD22-like protein n=1 Tax=Cinnamomum micranthum f. kanehirae TaxID=337451 RepID=A0A443N4E5_9MAGN|nr:RD22-like protein precursor [Cinnamomum micranthum f. kanehirae]